MLLDSVCVFAPAFRAGRHLANRLQNREFERVNFTLVNRHHIVNPKAQGTPLPIGDKFVPPGGQPATSPNREPKSTVERLD